MMSAIKSGAISHSRFHQLTELEDLGTGSGQKMEHSGGGI
jgi:hypothetical protein